MRCDDSQLSLSSLWPECLATHSRPYQGGLHGKVVEWRFWDGKPRFTRVSSELTEEERRVSLKQGVMHDGGLLALETCRHDTRPLLQVPRPDRLRRAAGKSLWSLPPLNRMGAISCGLTQGVC
jgi:hypothetical protein